MQMIILRINIKIIMGINGIVVFTLLLVVDITIYFCNQFVGLSIFMIIIF